jgi:pimeloyl-ACP methyl ester carboxylesterase
VGWSSSVGRLITTFTPAHRGGSGTPLVLLHGFMDSWRVWEPVLPALERRHDVLALTLAGHAGGPDVDGEPTADALADAIERAMDGAGLATAHVAGNSLGGFLALRLAARGRADSVVALAPAGGWARDDPAREEVLRFQSDLHAQVRRAAPHARAALATVEGRRRATRHLTVRFEHLPAELLEHQSNAVASCRAAQGFIEHGLREDWTLDAAAIACPVRIVWGTADVLLPWPSAAARYRHEWLPHADWVVLDDVGHYPQWDVPLETAQLILGFTS